MARIASTGTQFLVDTGEPPKLSLTITAFTAANPAVATYSGSTAPEPNRPIVIIGTGQSVIDGRVYRTGDVNQSAKTVEIIGLDNTGVGGATAGSGVLPDMIEVCVATFSRSSPAASEIDVTTLCDSTRQKLAGLKDAGSFTFDGFVDMDEAGTGEGFKVLREAYFGQAQRAFFIHMPDGSSISFKGQITALSESFGVDQAVTFSGEGVVSGDVIYGAAKIGVVTGP